MMETSQYSCVCDGYCRIEHHIHTTNAPEGLGDVLLLVALAYIHEVWTKNVNSGQRAGMRNDHSMNLAEQHTCT